MTQRVAILGWGSLIWAPKELAFDRNLGWQRRGPVLPIEFSRMSRRGRLTLVIDERNGVRVPTRYAASSLTSLDLAVANLAKREEVSDNRAIGYVEAGNAMGRSRTAWILQPISNWAAGLGFTHVVWTDLGPKPGYSIDWAIRYLESLRGEILRDAREYFLRAPEEVETPLRAALRERGWLTGS
jgi:hypothetical protein